MTDHYRYMPYPELVEGAPWDEPYRIIDSGSEPGLPSRGVTDMTKRRLFVPLGEDGRPIARHELAHVHWSPQRLPRVRYPLIVLQVVEDARINLALERLGLAVRLDPEQRTHVLHLAHQELKSGKLASFTLRWAASLGTDCAPDLERAAAEAAGTNAAFAAKLVKRVETRLERARKGEVIAPFKAAMTTARELARVLRARGGLDPAFREIAVEISCCLASDDDDGSPRRRLRLPGRGSKSTGADGAEALTPGEMEVVEAPLGLACPQIRGGLGRPWRPAVEGPHLGSFHRWTVDRAVFRRRARRCGGTVLIDTSGSMRLKAEDVDKILEASRGAAVIAIYSGSGNTGELRVVARRGRRAAREHLEPFGRGNIVDLPALGWLARQQRPRIWVSDGAVTGVDDRPTGALRLACRRTQSSGGIRRVASAKEAAELLTARRAGH
ncbi:MAG: hypothetical protein JRH19_11985 [Deltaproteobacteria bacterium]|nr:hypothetical protein [Deltaproteobacteria bacterium]